MSETPTLPLDLLATVPSASDPGLAAAAETSPDEQLSEFFVVLALELGEGQAPSSSTSVESSELPSVHTLAQDGKSLPPPSGMLLPPPSTEKALGSDDDGVHAVPASPSRPKSLASQMAPTSLLTERTPKLLVGGGSESPQTPVQVTRPAAAPVASMTTEMPETLTGVGVAETEARADSRVTDSAEVFSPRVLEQPVGASGEARIATEPPRISVAERQSFQLAEPMHTPRWNDGLANRVTWMVNQEVQRADLRLNPPELGPLEVRIAVTDDEARVTFTAQHALVREAVEAALPRLRELMAATGLNLVQVDVGQHSPGGSQQWSADADRSASSRAYGSIPSQDDGSTPGGARSSHEGLVDDYA